MLTVSILTILRDTQTLQTIKTNNICMFYIHVCRGSSPVFSHNMDQLITDEHFEFKCSLVLCCLLLGVDSHYSPWVYVVPRWLAHFY